MMQLVNGRPTAEECAARAPREVRCYDFLDRLGVPYQRVDHPAAETMEGRRRKKTYTITPAGRQAFAGWVAQPMQAGRVKNMELARLFFLGLAQPAQRAAAIRDYIRQMEETQAVLAAIREQFRKAQAGPLPPGQNWDEVFRFQGCTIEYGIAAAEFERQWYSRLLKELEEEE